MDGRRWQEKQRQFSEVDKFSPETQRHLRNVYLNLSLVSASAAVASYLYIIRYLPEPGLLSAAVFISPGVILSLISSPVIRNLMVYMFAFGSGWNFGPLLRSLLFFDPSVIPLSLVGTAVIFVSFSLTALMTERRSQLYLGGLLGSGLSLLSLLGLARWFVPSAEALFTTELYLGLLVFAGYVVFDTQVIVEQAEQGMRDVAIHTLNLYMNLFGIFIRLLVILAKKKEEQEQEERRRKDKKNK